MARLLVVEDDTSLRKIMRMVLSRAGHEAVMVDDGLAGFRRAVLDPFDLVITDLMMPDWDGLTFIRCLHIASPRLKVMVASGYINETVCESLFKEANVMAVITKPFRGENLLSIVNSCLETTCPALGATNATSSL